MTRRRSISLVAVALVASAAFGAYGLSAAPLDASAAPPVEADATAVTHWNQVAASTLAAVPGPNGGAPPAFQINMGMTQGAVYDAVNAIGPKRASALSTPEAFRGEGVDGRCRGDSRLRRALGARLDRTGASAVPGPRGAPADALLRIRSLARCDRRWPLQAAGHRRRARSSRRHARGEGERRTVRAVSVGAQYRGPDTGGRSSMRLGSRSSTRPHGWAASSRSSLQSSSQFRTAPPLALDSAAYAEEFNEVKDLGRATGSTRTDDQTYVAKWWQSAPILSWNEVARQLIARNDLNAADSARLLALQNLSGADAAINCWNDKYYYDFWRPWNAIPRAGEDDNPATDAEPGWTALITAPYPEHPSGHNCLDAAHVTILRMFFGDVIEGGFQITSASALLAPD